MSIKSDVTRALAKRGYTLVSNKDEVGESVHIEDSEGNITCRAWSHNIHGGINYLRYYSYCKKYGDIG